MICIGRTGVLPLAFLLNLVCHHNTRNTSSNGQDFQSAVLRITKCDVWDLIAICGDVWGNSETIGPHSGDIWCDFLKAKQILQVRDQRDWKIVEETSWPALDTNIILPLIFGPASRFGLLDVQLHLTKSFRRGQRVRTTPPQVSSGYTNTLRREDLTGGRGNRRLFEVTN